MAGNHVVLDLGSNAFVLLAHLRCGSLQVQVGDPVTAGEVMAECGNAGNSTEPHLHLQAMDAYDPLIARGLPAVFRDYLVVGPPGALAVAVERGLPRQRQTLRPR